MVQFSTYAPVQGYTPLRSAGPPTFYMGMQRNTAPHLMQHADTLLINQTPFATHLLNQPGTHPLLNTLALMLQQNTTTGKKPVSLTPKKGAEIGAISLGAMGLLFKGFSGLLWGGAIGAAAGSSIVSVVKRQGK